MKSSGNNEMVNGLKKLGYSKYRIAKELGIAFNTVHFWDKGIWIPNKVNSKALEELIKKGKWE